MNERVRRWVLLPALGLGLASAPHVAAQDADPVLPEAAPSEAAAPEATAPSVARPVPAAFNSPAATLRTFLEAMAEPPDEPRAVECMDISLVGEDVAREEAIKLWGILNRIEEVAFWQHPSARDLADPQRAQRFRGLSEGQY
ncbi:MAG: hypothetical protein ACYTGF_09660, partial [Planctomycetota bacterium]